MARGLFRDEAGEGVGVTAASSAKTETNLLKLEWNAF